jgi:hypothetical protein
MAPFITFITRMPEEKRQPLIEKAERYLASIAIGTCDGMPPHPPEERTGMSTR